MIRKLSRGVLHPALADIEWRGQFPQRNPEHYLVSLGSHLRSDSISNPTVYDFYALGGYPVKKWQCMVCSFVYEEELGLPEDGIAPGTSWDDIPDDWMCPDCGVGKEDFEMIEI
jgi:rubredoxin